MRSTKSIGPRSLRALILAAGLCLVLAPGTAFAAHALEGWTQFQGGPAHAGFIADGPAPPYQVAWETSIPLSGPHDTSGLSAPVITGDLSIAVGFDSVVAVDVSDGTIRWQIDKADGPVVASALADIDGRLAVLYTDGWGTHPPAQGASASSSVSDVNASTSRSDSAPASPPSGSPAPPVAGATPSRLVAVDVRSHQPIWRASLPELSRSGVTVDDGRAFVGDAAGGVTAVDLASGEVAWTTDVGGRIEAPLAAAEGKVMVAPLGDRESGLAFIALQQDDGSEAWRSSVDATLLLAGPLTVGNGLVYAAIADQSVRAFALDDGTERWSAPLNAPVNLASGPVVSADAVVVADLSGQVYRLDPLTGDRVWDQALNLAVFRSPPIQIAGYLLVPSADGTVSTIEISTGDLVFRSQLGSGVVRDMTPAGEVVIGVRGGTAPGLIGLAHDTDGSLVRVVTPTKLSLGTLLKGFALAAVPIGAVGYWVGRSLRPRVGPALPNDDLEDPDEPEPEDEDDLDGTDVDR